MDKQTIDSYNRDAETIGQLHSKLTPHRLYELIEEYFIIGGNTVDIGCGIGRDTHWLNQHGYPSIAIDASKEMLKQAASLYPNIRLIHDSLPDLRKLRNLKFQNILCSAVLMHLTKDDLLIAFARLIELLTDTGCLLFTFRGSTDSDNRENGKLYQPIAINEIMAIIKNNGCKVIFQEYQTEVLRGLTWHNFVVKKI